VYGVGPVGYQSCSACGAKWRYLWQHAAPVRVKPERSRPTYLVVVGILVAALVVAGAVVIARSKPWSTESSASPPASTTPSSTTTPPDTPALEEVRGHYSGIVTEMRNGRAAFVGWLDLTGPSAPQLEANEKADAYLPQLRSGITALENGAWPPAVAGSIRTLVDANQTFLQDLGRVYLGQQRSPSFVGQVDADAHEIQRAEETSRQLLGVPVANQ
jgi:hypothetical protein